MARKRRAKAARKKKSVKTRRRTKRRKAAPKRKRGARRPASPPRRAVKESPDICTATIAPGRSGSLLTLSYKLTAKSTHRIDHVRTDVVIKSVGGARDVIVAAWNDDGVNALSFNAVKDAPFELTGSYGHVITFNVVVSAVDPIPDDKFTLDLDVGDDLSTSAYFSQSGTAFVAREVVRLDAPSYSGTGTPTFTGNLRVDGGPAGTPSANIVDVTTRIGSTNNVADWPKPLAPVPDWSATNVNAPHWQPSNDTIAWPDPSQDYVVLFVDVRLADDAHGFKTMTHVFWFKR